MAFAVIYQWFSARTIIAVGETGLPFFNLQRTYSLSSYPYLDVQFGVANPFYIHFRPMWWIFMNIARMGIASWVLQALLFFVLLSIPLITTPLLLRKLFGKRYYFLGIISGLFYVFNLYVMSQVWVRLLYSLIILWSLLPLLLYLWIRWIDESNKLSLIILNLLFILFAGVFALPSGIIAVWITFILYIFLSEKKNKRIEGRYIKGILGFVIWIILSLWWLFPVVKISDNVYTPLLNKNNNLSSLNEVSKYYDNDDIFTLKQKYYFGDSGIFGDYDKNVYKKIISIVVFVMVIFGVLSSTKVKNIKYIYTLFLIGWFISKGFNPPLGKLFYTVLFSVSKYFEVLRNPYEKFGSIYVLFYSIFFALGIDYLTKKAGKNKYIVLVPLLVGIIFYLPSPIYSARLYSDNQRIKIPEDYNKVNRYVTEDSRILHLPFQSTADIKYLWGYRGEEPSMYLLDKSSISAPSSIKGLDEFYFNFGDYIENKNISSFLQITNTRYILLHNDKDLSKYYGYGYSDVKNFIENNKDMVFERQEGDLILYRYGGSISGWIYPVIDFQSVDSVEDLYSKITSDNFNGISTALVNVEDALKYEIENKIKNNSLPMVNYVKINPSKYIVNVSESNGFILILVNNFNSLWIASINGVPIKDHFMVNGYANGWIIENKGSYTVDIIFDVCPNIFNL